MQSNHNSRIIIKRSRLDWRNESDKTIKKTVG